jgi:hypothetical protein
MQGKLFVYMLITRNNSSIYFPKNSTAFATKAS